MLIVLATGCATFRVSDVKDLDSTPDGVRVYGLRTLVMVDSEPQPGTYIVTVPDPCRAYDVKPLTVLASQDFTIELGATGNVTTLQSNQDTTAFMTFVQGAATTAAKAAGLPVDQQALTGNFGLPDGVYAFDDVGALVMLYDANGKATPAAQSLKCE
jgi:hypothetical protein